MSGEVQGVVAGWRARGRPFAAGGIASVAWEEGDGAPVVLLHGVPASSFTYRKVLPELAARGLRGVAFDLPGLGLAERPASFDASWTGLGGWCAEATRALGLERFHLVVHDIGGPIGFDLVRRDPSRVLSLTALDTIGRPATFRRPWVMEPFAHRGLGEAWLASMRPFAFARLMRLIGVRSDVPAVELAAYVKLLRREDGGAAFLRIMRAFERTAAFEARIAGPLRNRAFPAQVLWGEDDPALPLEPRGVEVQELLEVDEIVRLPGRHFVQEDAPAEIAERVAALAASA